MTNPKLDLEIRDELLLLRAELNSAIKEVNADAKERSLNDCQCNHNKFAVTKFGFAVGYAKGACDRVLKILDRK